MISKSNKINNKLKHPTNTKGQVAIEFLLLTTFGIFFLFTILAVLGKISSDNITVQKATELQDLGTSIRNELSVASEMEVGYHRTINLPTRIKGQTYNLSIINGSSGNSYLVLASDKSEYFYQIPKSSGTIAPGENLIVRQDLIIVTHVP